MWPFSGDRGKEQSHESAPIIYSKKDPYYDMANSIAWKVNEDPSNGESLEAFIDRLTINVNLTVQELSEIPELVRISATVFESESLNFAYFRRRRIVDKFLGFPTDPRIAARYMPSLAERSKATDELKRKETTKNNELEKIRVQFESGAALYFNSDIVSESEVQAYLKWLELEKVKTQIANSEQLNYDVELVSLEEIDDLKLEVSSARFQWLNSRVRPAAQPYGVSNYGAERLVGDWLVYLGCRDVVITKASQDGGLDVETESHVCQVKYYKNQGVSVQEVREIFGVASAAGKEAMIFTSSSLTAAAHEFANQVGIVAVQFNVEDSLLVGLNYYGEQFLMEGEYE